MVLLLRKLYVYFNKDPEWGPLFSRDGALTFSRGGGGLNANFYRNPYIEFINHSIRNMGFINRGKW